MKSNEYTQASFPETSPEHFRMGDDTSSTGRAESKLVLRRPGQEPEEIVLGDRAITIGRDPACELVIESPYISRRHFRIEPHGSAYALVELGSPNPVEVNGHAVRGIRLMAPGDLVRVADVSLEFQQCVDLSEVTAIYKLEHTAIAATGRERLTSQFGKLECGVLVSELKDLLRVSDRLGELRLGEYLRVHDGIVREQLHGVGALIVKGDASHLGFLPDGESALRSAVAIQQRLGRYEYEHPSLPIRVGIGVGTGSPLAEEESSLECALTFAVSAADNAAGGEILISDKLRRRFEEGALGQEAPALLRSALDPRVVGNAEVAYVVDWRNEPAAAQPR